MIAYVDGILAEKSPARVVVEAAGIGYEIFVPLSSFDRLPPEGQRCRLLTYDLVREDARLLYGFATAAERDMFEMLMGVGGIGPKLALSALSGLTVRELKLAVVDGDVKRLSSISGIGRKMAERIVVELKDKISPADAFEAVAGAEELPETDRRLRDALMALISLGYRQDQARKMLASAAKDGKDLGVEELIRKALSGVSGG